MSAGDKGDLHTTAAAANWFGVCRGRGNADWQEKHEHRTNRSLPPLLRLVLCTCLACTRLLFYIMSLDTDTRQKRRNSLHNSCTDGFYFILNFINSRIILAEKLIK